MRVKPITAAELPRPPAGAFFRWEVPGEEIAVYVHLNIVELLERDAIRAGGKISAGVLLGRVDRGRQLTLTIEDYDPATPQSGAPDSPFGDRRLVESIIDRCRTGQRRMSIIGFYRICSGEGARLNKDDLAALDADTRGPRNFDPEHTERRVNRIKEYLATQGVSTDIIDTNLDGSTPSARVAGPLLRAKATDSERIFLLIEPRAGRTSNAVLYLARAGIVSWQSAAVPFSRAKLSKKGTTGQSQASGMRDRSFETQDAEVPDEQELCAQPKREPQGARKLRRLVASLAVAVILSVGFFQFRGQQILRSLSTNPEEPSDSHLGLKLKQRGAAWEVSWSRDTPILLKATKGHLSISDGVIRKELDLDPFELRNGTIMYTPMTDDLVMQLELESTKSAEPVSESVRIVAGLLPSFSSSQVQTRGASPDDRTDSQWLDHPATPPALGVRVSGKRSTVPLSLAADSAPAEADKSQTAAQSEIPNSPRQMEATPAEENPIIAPQGNDIEFPAPMFRVPPESAPNPPALGSELLSPVMPPVQQGGKVEAAQLISRRDPVYPPAARRTGISGAVEVHFKIGLDGEVRDVTATEGAPVLAQPAVEAVREWRYKPARLNGVPTEVEAVAVVVFKLN